MKFNFKVLANDWWNSLDGRQQREYLKMHDNSVYKAKPLKPDVLTKKEKDRVDIVKKKLINK